MRTKLDIIDRAYSEIGMAKYVFEITPEEQREAVNVLDDFMLEMAGNGIEVGYNFPAEYGKSNPGDDSGIVGVALSAIPLTLALRLVSGFGKQASPELKLNQYNAYNAMLISIRNIPRRQFPAYMPVGQGNRRSPKSPQYYQPTPKIETSNDGNLDLY